MTEIPKVRPRVAAAVCKNRVWDAASNSFVLSSNELSETLSSYECALSAHVDAQDADG